MTDRMSIEGPVKIETKNDAAAAVAYQLMERISAWEDSESIIKHRRYWLELYCQCYQATHGCDVKHILQEK